MTSSTYGYVSQCLGKNCNDFKIETEEFLSKEKCAFVTKYPLVFPSNTFLAALGKCSVCRFTRRARDLAINHLLAHAGELQRHENYTPISQPKILSNAANIYIIYIYIYIYSSTKAEISGRILLTRAEWVTKTKTKQKNARIPATITVILADITEPCNHDIYSWLCYNCLTDKLVRQTCIYLIGKNFVGWNVKTINDATWWDSGKAALNYRLETQFSISIFPSQNAFCCLVLLKRERCTPFAGHYQKICFQ